MKRILYLLIVLALSLLLVAPATALAGVGPAPKTTGEVVTAVWDYPTQQWCEARISWNAHAAFGDKPAKGNLTYELSATLPDGTKSVLESHTWPVTECTKIDDHTYRFYAPGSYASSDSLWWSGGRWTVIDGGEPAVDDTFGLWCNWCYMYHFWFQISGGNIQAH